MGGAGERLRHGSDENRENTTALKYEARRSEKWQTDSGIYSEGAFAGLRDPGGF